MPRELDLYLIETRTGRFVLFSPPDAVAAVQSSDSDRIRRFLEWLRSRKNRILGWLGRVLTTAHRYYEALEDRIDPLERVLKAMAGADRLIVYSSPARAAGDSADRLRALLVRQYWKHVFWIIVDGAISLGVGLLTPFLAPIPGPNVFAYYPLLRFLSHWRAWNGAAKGRDFTTFEIRSLPSLSALEENLRRPRRDRQSLRTAAESLNVSGLVQFVERMG